MLILKQQKMHKFFLHIILIIIFSVLYYLTQIYEKNINSYFESISFYECFYFSIVTQSTIGYGHIFPNNKIMKNLAILQMLFILLLILT